MKVLFLLLSLLQLATSTIYTDTGCSCALTKTTITTPNASSTIAAGCSFKTDWNAQNTEWCLTDQTNGVCGTFQPSFGFVDSCANAAFTKVNVLPPPALLEWDQNNTIYYTGQILNTTWQSQNIGIDEWVRVQYQGQNTRVLTTGSGVNITQGFYAVRLSDSNNAPTNGRVPIQVNLPTTASITTNSEELIQVIQSKIMNAAVFDGTRQLVTGQTATCDDRNVTIMWRGLGQAQIGNVTVQIQRSGGSTIVGSPISGFLASGNMTVNYTLPRSFTPSGFSQYQAVITVQEFGQSAYTANSASFSLAAAPSTTPTPTPSNTPSKSSTPTPSTTPSPSSTPSNTRTPTPTNTPTSSPTSSMTPSNTPTISTTPSPINLAALAAAAAASVDTTTPVIGAVVGSIAGMLVFIGAFKYFQSYRLTELRKKKLKMSAKFAQEASTLYHLDSSYTNRVQEQPSIVMYSVNVTGANTLTSSKKKQGFTPEAIAPYKK